MCPKVSVDCYSHYLFLQLYFFISSVKGGLRNFAKFIGKHLYQSLFFNKVAGHLFLQNACGGWFLLYRHNYKHVYMEAIEQSFLSSCQYWVILFKTKSSIYLVPTICNTVNQYSCPKLKLKNKKTWVEMFRSWFFRLRTTIINFFIFDKRLGRKRNQRLL